MTYPRSQLVDADNAGYYHCVSRCVRRAFLCGFDHLTGRNFDHRKGWIERRLLELAEAFAVSVFAYAVMDNHLHLVLRVDPEAPLCWDDSEVARRWLMVFPGRLGKSADSMALDRAIEAICSDPERLKELRCRLGSLSWFMRALNEPIARRANREDKCSGRFWEGRFKCQALLDERAVLSCMAYVDLNPVRAGMCDRIADCEHTSIRRRLAVDTGEQDNCSSDRASPGRPLKPVAGLTVDDLLGLTEASYIELVQWTGEQAWPGKRGRLPTAADPVPDAVLATARPAGSDSHSDQPTIRTCSRAWLRQVKGTESLYYRAIGSAEAMITKATDMGQRWLKGVSRARISSLTRRQAAS